MSPHQAIAGAAGAKRRSTRSGSGGASRPGSSCGPGGARWADDVVSAHEAFDALVVDAATSPAQLVGHPRGSVGLVEVGVDLSDLGDELGLVRRGLARAGRLRRSTRSSWRARSPPPRQAARTANPSAFMAETCR